MEAWGHLLFGVAAYVVVFVSSRSWNEIDRTARSERRVDRLELLVVAGRLKGRVPRCRRDVDAGGVRGADLESQGGAQADGHECPDHRLAERHARSRLVAEQG